MFLLSMEEISIYYLKIEVSKHKIKSEQSKSLHLHLLLHLLYEFRKNSGGI